MNKFLLGLLLLISVNAYAVSPVYSFDQERYFFDPADACEDFKNQELAKQNNPATTTFDPIFSGYWNVYYWAFDGIESCTVGMDSAPLGFYTGQNLYVQYDFVADACPQPNLAEFNETTQQCEINTPTPLPTSTPTGVNAGWGQDLQTGQSIPNLVTSNVSNVQLYSRDNSTLCTLYLNITKTYWESLYGSGNYRQSDIVNNSTTCSFKHEGKDNLIGQWLYLPPIGGHSMTKKFFANICSVKIGSPSPNSYFNEPIQLCQEYTPTPTNTPTSTNTPTGLPDCPLGIETQQDCICRDHVLEYNPEPCPQGNMCVTYNVCPANTSTPTLSPSHSSTPTDSPTPTPTWEEQDADGDGIPNGSDPDIDNDGTPNGADPDRDGDGIPNESDGDGGGDITYTPSPTPTDQVGENICTVPVPQNNYCDCDPQSDEWCHNPSTTHTPTPTDEGATPTHSPTPTPTDETTPTDEPSPTGLPTPTPDGATSTPTNAISPTQPPTVTGGTDCNSPPVCTGDPISCGLLRQSWESRCKLEKSQIPNDDNIDFSSFKNSNNDVFDQFDYVMSMAGTAGNSSSCPAPIQIDLIGASPIIISFQPFCDIALYLRPIIKLLFFLLALRVLFRGL